MELFWQKAAQQKKDLRKGKDLLAYYRKMAADVLHEKDDRARRQAELWTVGELNDSLTSEYKGVSGKIAYLIKQDLALKKYISDLDIELYHCQFGQCDILHELLGVNPLTDVDGKVPMVDFAHNTVTG